MFLRREQGHMNANMPFINQVLKLVAFFFFFTRVPAATGFDVVFILPPRRVDAAAGLPSVIPTALSPKIFNSYSSNEWRFSVFLFRWGNAVGQDKRKKTLKGQANTNKVSSVLQNLKLSSFITFFFSRWPKNSFALVSISTSSSLN